MQPNTDYIKDNTNLHALVINRRDFTSITETKSYAPLTSCTLEYTLTSTTFSNREKLYLLLTDSLALISKNSGGVRSIALPSEDWGRLLDCSRSSVFIMQKSLEDKGHFNIKRGL